LPAAELIVAADAGQAVKKYEVTATFRDGVVSWTFGIMTADGKTYRLDVRDAEEIPQLMDVCRRDWTIFFDPERRRRVFVDNGTGSYPVRRRIGA
jgi:hypothetical protein